MTLITEHSKSLRTNPSKHWNTVYVPSRSVWLLLQYVQRTVVNYVVQFREASLAQLDLANFVSYIKFPWDLLFGLFPDSGVNHHKAFLTLFFFVFFFLYRRLNCPNAISKSCPLYIVYGCILYIYKISYHSSWSSWTSLAYLPSRALNGLITPLDFLVGKPWIVVDERHKAQW